MELINSHGETIHLDSRYDINKIKSLLSDNNHKGLDSYLESIAPFPTHSEGGVDIKFEGGDVSFVRGHSSFKAEEGVLLPSNGLIVSKLYERITGKDWQTAKSEGLTDGSYENNILLRKRLLSGEFGDVVSNKTSDMIQVTKQEE